MNKIKNRYTEIIKGYPHFLIQRNYIFINGEIILDTKLIHLLSFQLRDFDEISNDKDYFQEYLEFYQKIKSLNQNTDDSHQPQSINLADLIEETKEPFAYLKYKITSENQ